MKKTIKIFALGLLSAALFSCQDAALPTIDNLVYISDAANGRLGVVNMADAGEDTKVSFTVRLAQKAEEDIKVAITIDESILKNYNESYQASFNHVAAENIEAPALAVIPAGSISSDPVTINVKSFETMGAQYALSFKITSKGSIPVAEASSQYIIQLMKPLKQLVPTFSRACAMQCAPVEEAWGYSLMNYTLEWWVKMSSLNINNQAIINSGGQDCELYIRFGDLIYSGSSGYDNRFLQIKTMGSQFDTGNPTQGNALNHGQWYHFAISYDGNTGKSIMYKDGQMVAELSTGAGRPMNIDRFQMCSSNSYFPNQAEMCQVRLWKTTRTAAQIQKNMRSEVEYSNPDLIMYLPMSEGPGATKLNDVTGNGHDCNIGNLTSAGGNGIGTQAVAWTEYAF
ncbi:MAG: DUF1735 and LamG domain-containing protein [Bacteroidales bacterium]|nr:DUF1735 and LamG domain-containing protein [Bacteroidales bacterium]